MMKIQGDTGEKAPLLSSSPGPLLSPSTVSWGFMLALISAIAQAVRATLIHVVLHGTDIPASSALLVSAVAYIVLSSLYLLVNRLLHELRIDRRTAILLVVRGLLSGTYVYTNNLALARVPVGTALTLFAVSPAITFVLAALFLGDSISWRDVFVLVANLIGVVLVAHPSGAAGHSAQMGVLFAMTSAALVAITFILVKKIGTRAHFILNVLAMGMGCAVVSAFAMNGTAIAVFQEQPKVVAVCALAGTLGFVSQALLNKAMQVCRPGPTLIIRSANVPVSFILGFVFLGEMLGLSAMVGVFIVIASVLYIGLKSR